MTLWYVGYHGPRFTKSNPSYKSGWTIGKLRQNDQNQLFFTDVIKSPDDLDHQRFESGFWDGTTSTKVIDRDPHVIIKWIFEKVKK